MESAKKFARFEELDLMRGFAACWIVGLHFWYVNLIPKFLGYKNFFDYIEQFGQAYSIAKFLPLPLTTAGNLLFNSLNSFFILGYQGVHIFFVLSGFGLTYSMVLKPEKSWLNFTHKKFIRIYPTYWLLLIFCILIPWLRFQLFFGYPDFSIPSMARSFLLLDKAIPYSWFMFPLIQFYLAFFLLFRLLNKYSMRRFLVGSFLIKFIYTLSILMLSYYVYPNLLGDGAYPGYIAISRLFEFSLGMVFAKVYVNNPQQLINYLTNIKIIILAIICEFIGILGSFKFTNEITILNYQIPLGISVYDALIGFGIFVIIFNVVRLIIKFSNLLNTFFSFVSKLSYEFYLTQFISLLIITKLFYLFIPKESSLLTSGRSILLYILALNISIFVSLLLQNITNLILKKNCLIAREIRNK